MLTTIQGLSQDEVVFRRQAGQGNDIDVRTSRTYLQILYQNIFTFVNIVLIIIGILLAILGSPSDAITTSTLVVLNILVGITQEMRAKRQLDQIALLTRPTVSIIRDGIESNIDPSEIVLGDATLIHAGDQILSDGKIITDSRLEVNESLLTGESDNVVKLKGDIIYSGSYCVTGQGIAEVSHVGIDSFANRLTSRARAFKTTLTPLQRDVNLVVRIVAFIAILMYAWLYLDAQQADLPIVERVEIAAVVMGMIPQGLIFLVTLTYAIGAVRVSQQGALIQQLNAVESLSNIDVLCLDKTGTLTTNNIQLDSIHPINLDVANKEVITEQLAIFSASVTSSNRTSDAIKQAHQVESIPFVTEIPFSSVYKWSGLVFDHESMHGTYIFGAPEVIHPNLRQDDQHHEQLITSLTEQGLRVLTFAYHNDNQALRDADDQPNLPTDLTLLGIVTFVDELRADASDTLKSFKDAGIEVKVISGDNPLTVSALADQVNFGREGRVVSGLELADMDTKTLEKTIKETSVFGRITPDQKEQIITTLQQQGHYVAMIGDGVNDVLSLKMADVGIAMQGGSTATRNIADIVLLDDSFSVLPEAFKSGQRIINGIEATMLLLLTRTTYVALLVLLTSLAGLSFPFVPSQDALNSFVTAGLPPFLLALWAIAQAPTKPLLRKVRKTIVPTAIIVALFGFPLYWWLHDHNDLMLARTILINFVIICGLTWILFVRPPHQYFAVVNTVTQDYRPMWLTLLSILAFISVQAVEFVRQFFELSTLNAQYYLLILGLTAVWAIILRAVLNWRLPNKS